MVAYRLHAEGGTIALTPYIMARTAHHFFTMSHGYESGREIPFARHYLYCASIEIGQKAAILANECSAVRKKLIKSFGQDLTKAWGSFQQFYGSQLWSAEDIAAVTAINPFFVNKGLEYFTIDVLIDTASGSKGLPDIGRIERAAKKVNSFIVERQFFKNL